MDVLLGKQKVVLDATNFKAKGGEADIFMIDPDRVVKIFKGPDHPDLAGMAEEQTAAKFRLEQHQQKLPQLLQRKLPPNIIGPQELAMAKIKGKQYIAGFSMRFIDGANTLLSYTDMNFKKAIHFSTLMKVLLALRSSVKTLHDQQIIIGDFNDLNVLVAGDEVYLIDVDSYQFDQWLSYVFTQRFIDPLLAAITDQGLALTQPYVPNADWYAYSIMVMQTLLSAGPYSGITDKKNANGKRYKMHERIKERMTVFSPSVRYPGNAVPFGYLPDDLLHHLHLVFEKDRRGEFPESLLQFQWQKCDTCGIWHARAVCPSCAKPAPAAVKQKVQIRGNVTSTRIFSTHGNILYATMNSGKLEYLYHQNGEFRREGEYTVLKGSLDPLFRYRVQGGKTLIGRQNQLLIFDSQDSNHPQQMSVDSFGNLAMFDTNKDKFFWVKAGRLMKTHALGADYVGDTLANQTLFWVGNHKGFGFYNAGNIRVAFMFDSNNRGIRDDLAPLTYTGQLVDSTAVFGQETIWVFYSSQEKGKIINRCRVYSFKGETIGGSEDESGSDGWLGNIRGKTVIGNRLLSISTTGIMRVNAKAGMIVEAEYPDTEPFVHSGCHLFAGPQGLYVIDSREIRLLAIK